MGKTYSETFFSFDCSLTNPVFDLTWVLLLSTNCPHHLKFKCILQRVAQFIVINNGMSQPNSLSEYECLKDVCVSFEYEAFVNYCSHLVV